MALRCRMPLPRFAVALPVMTAALVIVVTQVGCGGSDRTDGPSAEVDRSQAAGRELNATATGGSVEARRAALLNRIRSSDPQKATIERAVINEKNELGLILSRQTNMDDVPRLMKAMLTQMAEDFPNQDLTVIAYTPTEPPRTIGTARLDASTRDMTYHPAK
jgi:hypothetical protein